MKVEQLNLPDATCKISPTAIALLAVNALWHIIVPEVLAVWMEQCVIVPHADPVQAGNVTVAFDVAVFPDTDPNVIVCLAYPFPLISLPPASVGSAVYVNRYKVVGLVNEFELKVYCNRWFPNHY